jgi:orotate phosphoribosyltransferase
MSKVLELLKQTGAVLTDSHFVGTSGKHFPTYINKDALYPHTRATSEICRLLAEKVKDLDIDVVVGPALGGIILSTWTAHHLSEIKGREILGVYTEKAENNNQVFTRGYDKLVVGKKVLVVEDLTTTGGSAKKVVESVKAAGASVAAVIVMVNKNPQGVTSEYFGVPFYALDVLEVPVYEEAECVLCKQGVPINTGIGHGKKFLEAKGLAK